MLFRSWISCELCEWRSASIPARLPAQVGACPPPMRLLRRQGLVVRRATNAAISTGSDSQQACAGDLAAIRILLVLLCDRCGGATARSTMAAEVEMQISPRMCALFCCFSGCFLQFGDSCVCLDVSSVTRCNI